MPKAKAAALEALRLDPGLAEGHTWLGVVHFLFDWDWSGAEQEFRRALQLQPDQAYAETWYATFLSAMGRDEEAMQRIHHAHALEPLSLSIKLCIGRSHFFAGRYAEALGVIEEILRDEPGHLLSTIWALRTLSALGRFADALEAARELPPRIQTPYLRSCIAYALAGMGAAEEARKLCAELRQEAGTGGRFSLFFVAGVQVRLGEIEAALDTLTECQRIRDGQLAFLRARSAFDGLRGHPRYERLLAEMDFPRQVRLHPASA